LPSLKHNRKKDALTVHKPFSCIAEKYLMEAKTHDAAPQKKCKDNVAKLKLPTESQDGIKAKKKQTSRRASFLWMNL